MIPSRLLRPPRLRTRFARAAATLSLLAVLLILPFPLSPRAAGSLAIIGLVAILLLLLLFTLGGWSRLRRLLPQEADFLASPLDGLALVVGFIRRTGLAPLGLVFLLFWMLVYMGAWALDPSPCSPDLASPCTGAFAGAGDAPSLGSFMYLSVNLAVANPPADLFPVSSLTHALASLEVLSGLALVTFAASAFFGMRSES